MSQQHILFVREDGVISASGWIDNPNNGPTTPVFSSCPGETIVAFDGEFTREGRRDTEVAYLRNGAVEWEDRAVLEDEKVAAVTKTYPDVDSVYQDAIGLRATEYANAESAARAYIAADPKPSPASGYITGHALNNPTGQVQSEVWAAQQIIERADAFRWAELQMRNVRFLHQAEMRAATSLEMLDAAVASWDNFIKWLREILGL